MSTTRRITAALLTCFVFIGCTSRDDAGGRDTAGATRRGAVSAAAADTARVAAVDDPEPAPVLEPGSGRPYPGTWTPTVTYQDSLFTIDVPTSAEAAPRPAEPRFGRPHREVSVSRLPECLFSCYVTITVQRDSTGAGVSRMVHDLTTADSTSNPDDGDYVATVLDSLPLGAARAIHLHTYCGDCSSWSIVTASGGWIATIDYSLDDRNPFSPALNQRLLNVARSFRWRR